MYFASSRALYYKVSIILVIIAKATSIIVPTSSIQNEGKPPVSLQDPYTLMGHNKTLFRVYLDDHVAFYYDSEMTNSIRWPFSPLSKAWKYMKETYGASGILYAILHGNDERCIRDVARHHSKIATIDCGFGRKGINSTINDSAMLQKLLSVVGHNIIYQISNFGYFPDHYICYNGLVDIVGYDAYVNLTGQSQGDVSSWMRSKYTDDFPICFQKWFLPIYKAFGGTSVLVNFVSLVRSNWFRVKGPYDVMNIGEYVHFWSGAACTNLENVARNPLLFEWQKVHVDQLAKARQNFPHIEYLNDVKNVTSYGSREECKWQEQLRCNNEPLSLVYMDEQVLVYSENNQRKPSWSGAFETIGVAWKYVKDTYGFFHPTSLLYVVLHKGNTANCNQSNSGSNPELKITYVNMSLVNDALIDVDNVITHLGFIPLESEFPMFNVSRLSLASIITYDIHLNLRRVVNGQRWLQMHLNESENFPRNKTFWFRDWHLKIYERHGGVRAVINLFRLLRSNWSPRDQHNVTRQFNVGEFVHYWSGAAEWNLRELAEDAFGWNEVFEMQLLHARLAYPNVTYALKRLDTSTIQSYIVLMEKTLGSLQLIRHVGGDENLAVYFDSNIPSSVNWPHRFLSTCQPYLKRYSNLLRNSNSRIYLTFHPKRKKNCEFLHTWAISIGLGRQEIRNVIDCGYFAGSKYAWINGTFENVATLGNIVLAQMIFPDTENQAGVSAFNIAVYDMFMKEGRTENANRWLSDKLEEAIIFGSRKYWLEDWYFKIYQRSGDISVMTRFFNISDQWQSFVLMARGNRASKMNVGDIVHLWSGAAGENLRDLAVESFGWNKFYQEEFNKSRAAFPLNYSCINCDELPEAQPDSASSADNTSDIIIGVLISVVILGFLILGTRVVIYRKRVKRMSEQIRKLTVQDLDDFYKGNSNVDGNDAHASIQMMPFNTMYEISRSRVVIDESRVLGSGEFGVVTYGIIKNDGSPGSMNVEVAVKTIKKNLDISYFKALLSEIKIMAFLGQHENIASLLGTVTHNIRNCEVLVAIEFCAKGDLLQYLRKSRSGFLNLWSGRVSRSSILQFKKGHERVSMMPDDTITTSSCSNDVRISTVDLLSWACQISNGMAYLSSKNVVHGDLAARNVLLTINDVAKISDFGLSRQLINYAIYKKESHTPLPWKWLAIESLSDMTFSVHSDIWSFGVTLWEIFTLGKVPYPGKTWNDEYVEGLIRGQRLNLPEFGNKEIHDLMLDCMKIVPIDRTPFLQIRTKLVKLKAKILLTHASSDESRNYLSTELLDLST